MSGEHLEYLLSDGYVDNWLVAGPHAVPVPDLNRFQGDDLRSEIAHAFSARLSEIHEPPLEESTFQIGDRDLTWRYYRCREDHWVDLSEYYARCHYLRSWAYCQVLSPSLQEATFVLTTNGPADVWLNRHHVHRHEHFRHQEPASVTFRAALEDGPNEILVRFEEVALRACPYVMALQITGTPTHNVTVQLPTWHTNVPRRQKLERVYQQAHLEHRVTLSDEHVVLRWADQIAETDDLDYWVQDWRQHIQTAGRWETKPSERTEIGGRGFILEEGPHRVALLPPGHVIQRYDIRYQEYLPFHVLAHPYSERHYGTYQDRRKEALEYAVGREDDLYAEIAKLHLGRWSQVEGDLVEDAIRRVDRREDGSVAYLVGLLGVLVRYPKSPALSEALRQALEGCILNFKYWHDEPGTDVMCYTSESQGILYHTCEILAGQLYPKRTFANAGQVGWWHREKGERLALDWLSARGTTGFAEWDSNEAFEADLLALSHLSDLAEDEQLRELAAVVMDKMLFSMALNSYEGVYGSTHGRTEAPMIASGQLEATSGIARLMWGMGVWNHHIRGLVGLACSDYELPPHLLGIVTEPPEELWSREQHPGVNKVTYRTPDYMLCSAQDYCPGERGDRQHIWQATLGPEAIVYVNHPSCTGQQSAHRPNFWRGNAVLPRVAQWKDALIAIYRLPEGDRMGFTHAYCPVHEFDEWVLREGWAFARVEAGYLALTASLGLELVQRGPPAYHELRSYGLHNVWLCFMGREAIDGTFDEFQGRVLALEVQFGDLGVRCSTLRDETLAFTWRGPFLVSGEEQPLSGFKHYESPYCVADLPATQMDIHYGDYLLRLDFSM